LISEGVPAGDEGAERRRVNERDVPQVHDKITVSCGNLLGQKVLENRYRGDIVFAAKRDHGAAPLSKDACYR